jgi:hypothetical protein
LNIFKIYKMMFWYTDIPPLITGFCPDKPIISWTAFDLPSQQAHHTHGALFNGCPGLLPACHVQGSLYPHPGQQIAHVFDKVILTGVGWYLTVVLICNFLITCDVKHIFIYLLSIYLSLKKCLFWSLSHFLMV